MQQMGPGILADWQIVQIWDSGIISADLPCDANQIQPASLDLRCGARAYRLQASFLPGRDRAVQTCLEDSGLCEHILDLTQGCVLETGCVYLIPLCESVNLPDWLCAFANPKSSTGRIDVFTRVITDRATGFDSVAANYTGPLYLEVSPRTFPVLVRQGDRLAQIRFQSGAKSQSHTALVNVDLSQESQPVGWRARAHSRVIDLSQINAYHRSAFWEPVYATDNQLILQPEAFYILMSREAITVPVGMAAEMHPIATELGEFRVHYAGFFDPGFGADGQPSRAVLEVRCRDVPFVLADGQPVARLEFVSMSAKPQKLYGKAGNNYQGQSLRLSKHFQQ